MIHLGFINFITYFFILVTLFAAGGMVIKKNPIHAVLFLIASFVGGSGLLLINNAEFLSFIVLSVYVGAVMVLFLFVVMMIDVDSIKYSKLTSFELLSGVLCGLIIFILFSISATKEIEMKNKLISNVTEVAMTLDNSSTSKNQAKEFGKILYSEDNILFIIISSMILFVAIVGTVTLTIREKSGLKKQNLFSQLLRSREDTIEVKKVLFGDGVDDGSCNE